MVIEIDVSCFKKSFAQNSKSCLDTDSNDTESMDGTNVIDDSILNTLNVDDDELNSLED